MKSKTRIEKKLRRKTSPALIKVIINAKKHSKWLKVADTISNSRRKKISVNLEKINKEAREGDIIVVPGKVLSAGGIDKKIKIVALAFSQEAKKKLEKKCIIAYIKDEIKENPNAEGVKIIK